MSEKKLTPFDHANRINSSSATPESLEGYSSWVVTNYYTMYPETCEIAELAGTLNVPDHIHDLFLRGAIMKRKRPHAWVKSTKNERAKRIMDAFGISQKKALEYEPFVPNSALERAEKMKKEKDLSKKQKVKNEN